MLTRENETSNTMTTITTTQKSFAPTYYTGKPLALAAVTGFGGASVHEYETVDISTENRTILVHCFDVLLWCCTPTVENATAWLHAKEYASELFRNKISNMPEGWQTHEQSATRHADHAVACTEWEVLTNDEGKTVIRGWFREDLS